MLNHCELLNEPHAASAATSWGAACPPSPEPTFSKETTPLGRTGPRRDDKTARSTGEVSGCPCEWME